MGSAKSLSPSRIVSAILACLFFFAAINVWAGTFVLSGGENPEEQISVDDLINVYLNDQPVFSDPSHYAGPRNPIVFEAEDGDTLRIVAIDYFGHCRSISDVYLHNVECETSEQLIVARNDGCAGYPAGAEFINVTHTIVGSCEEVPEVKRMRCAKGSPSIKLLDQSNKVIRQNSSDFPSEAFAKGVNDGEKVLFELEEAPRTKKTYRVEGWVALNDNSPYMLFGPKNIVFPKKTKKLEVTFRGRSQVKFITSVQKTPAISWKFYNPKTDKLIGEKQVTKTIYHLLAQPVGYMKKPRLEILDLVNELVPGMSDFASIRTAIEAGIYNRYKFPIRNYSSPGHYSSAFNEFDLTKFLADNYVDCADVSIMLAICCNVLGVPQSCAMIQEDPKGGPRTEKLIVKVACDSLGNIAPYAPGELKFEGSGYFTRPFHIVGTYTDGKGNKHIYDPLIKFADADGNFNFCNGISRTDYASYWVENIVWRGFTLGKIK